ncbi:MAG TPA: SIMPL domain-containing protein [Bacteroidia bacterium]|nr:SIMPL domain-containing protein [Bacteroidia bacterium]
MKKTASLLLCVFALTLFAKAQSTATITTNPPEHVISVTGMAEMEIVPDEIYVNVCITEFTKDKKKYNIEGLENAFLNFLDKSTSTPRTDVTMDFNDARIIAMKRKQKDAIITKTYEVKFKDNDQVTMLFLAEDSLNLTDVYIKRYSSSKMDDYKQQVRVNAMADAKTKATYMLTAISQKPGNALYVSEIYPDVLVFDGIHDMDYYNNLYRNVSTITGGIPSLNPSGNYGREDYRYLEDEEYSGGSQYDPIVKKIKLKYWVNVTFAISQ